MPGRLKKKPEYNPELQFNNLLQELRDAHEEADSLGRYPVVCRSWRKSTLRNMFLFLFHYLEKVSSLSCGPVEIYDRSRYQQWRYDCDPEAIEKKMGKQR